MIDINNTRITPLQLEEAQRTIFQWFIEVNAEKGVDKPITVLDTEVEVDGKQFRLITHLSFYGRDELPKLAPTAQKESK